MTKDNLIYNKKQTNKKIDNYAEPTATTKIIREVKYFIKSFIIQNHTCIFIKITKPHCNGQDT